MNKYQKAKENARKKAIEWQLNNDGLCLSWSELVYYQIYFEMIGRRYGLLKEFRENGIC